MMRKFPWLLGVVMLVLASACGCRTAEVAEPLTQKMAANGPQTQMQFWHALADRKVTSNDEAFHGLLLFLDGQDPAADYGGRLEVLKSRGLLPTGFERPANEAVNRGTLAVLLVRALQVDGGLLLRLFPHSPRYATRELQFLGLYPRSSPHQTFSGPEFLGIMGRVEDYERHTTVRVPAKQMPAIEKRQPAKPVG